MNDENKQENNFSTVKYNWKDDGAVRNHIRNSNIIDGNTRKNSKEKKKKIIPKLLNLVDPTVHVWKDKAANQFGKVRVRHALCFHS